MKSIGNFKFYSVVGKNGVAVMDSWDGAERITRYIKNPQFCGFDAFADAEDWALLMFADYLPREYTAPIDLTLNRAVFMKNLRPDWL